MNKNCCMMVLVFCNLIHAYPHIGVATSAYQIEGAFHEKCKGFSIWDKFANDQKNIKDGTNGSISCDHYNHVAEDINILADLGIRHYRFSISWSRIFPSGRGIICDDGIRFYNEILDNLELHKIQPFVTMFHWDLPLYLEESYGGWLNPQIVDDFTNYADFLFGTFGNRVKNWITINEPFTYCVNGYANGLFAPGIKDPIDKPYICGHNIILAHISTYRLYNSKYRNNQNGNISIAINSDWVFPLRPSDNDAVARAIDWHLNWFASPIITGKYPKTMIDRLGPRLAKLPTNFENHSFVDFFSLNHYTSFVVSEKKNDIYDFFHDPEIDCHPILYHARSDSSWLYYVPEGSSEIIRYMGLKYQHYFKDHPLVITENGVSMHNEYNELRDPFRIQYISDYLQQMVKASNESNILFSHYFIWSFLDNFEWASGYTERFGIIFVDFDDPQKKRAYKESAVWIKSLQK